MESLWTNFWKMTCFVKTVHFDLESLVLVISKGLSQNGEWRWCTSKHTSCPAGGRALRVLPLLKSTRCECLCVSNLGLCLG